jgi:hypothetical protein
MSQLGLFFPKMKPESQCLKGLQAEIVCLYAAFTCKDLKRKESIVP